MNVIGCDLMLPKVDFCVPIGGPASVILCRMFFGSLFKTSDTSDTTFHLINKGLSNSEAKEIESMFRGTGHDPIWYSYDKPFNHSTSNSKDTYETDEWLMDNCGASKWVVLSHFDMYFKLDFLSNMKRRINDNNPRQAMLGQHCPIMMLNREAYRESWIKFKDVAPFFAVMIDRDPKNQAKLRFGNDKRIGGQVIPIVGFDVGELLELELRIRGWEVEPLQEEFDAHFHHFGGGGSFFNGVNRYQDEIVKSYHRRAAKYISENL